MTGPLFRSAAFAFAAAVTFLAVVLGFFLLIGKPPFAMLGSMALYAFGDAYSISESLVKATPILLCALAVAVPARIGLISVGADGQLYIGALLGTAIVLQATAAPGVLLLPAMLVLGAAGGAGWAGLCGLLRARLGANETITTLLLNYVGVLLVSFAVYGPWKDPGNLGWPATIGFPPAAIVPSFLGTRVHLGLVIGILAAILLHIVATRSRWGLMMDVMRSNPRVGAMIGLRFGRAAVLAMAVGGAFAGLAGICETSAIQGRLQPGLSLGYGVSGFLVAWLAGHRFLLLVPLSILLGGLLAAGDSLQLFAKVPASSATVLQGLLFVTALAVSGLANRRRNADA